MFNLGDLIQKIKFEQNSIESIYVFERLSGKNLVYKVTHGVNSVICKFIFGSYRDFLRQVYIGTTLDGLKLDYVPRILYFDSDLRLIVYEYFFGNSFDEFVIHEDIATIRDRTMNLFSNINLLTSQSLDRIIVDENLPWIFKFLSPNTLNFDNLTIGQIEIIKIVHSDLYLLNLCLKLKNNWAKSSCIHGDIRPENILSAKSTLVLIDWEYISFGPPGWNLSGIISSIIISILRNMDSAVISESGSVDTSKISSDQKNKLVEIASWINEGCVIETRVMIALNLYKYAIELSKENVYVNKLAAAIMQIGLNICHV